MKITDISVVRVTVEWTEPRTPARRQAWAETAEVANPMSRYAKVKRHRSLWLPKWEGAWVKVTAEDGTWGLGTLPFARALTPVVEHLAAQLINEDCMAIEKLADMMFRLTKPYGTVAAISAEVDGGMFDPRGFRCTCSFARTPALADVGDRRALVHACALPVGHPPPCGRHFAT